MSITFQHSGTTRERDEEYHLAVRLYGRQADGKSVAVTVRGVNAYGFLRCACDATFKHRVKTLLQWWLSMQRSVQSAKKYKKNNGGDDKPIEEVCKQWQDCASSVN